jgi:hypothetical protein
MTSASIMVIARKHSEYAVAGLMGVVVLQGIGYGLVFDLNFFLRNLSVMGGLLMVLSDSWVRKKFAPAGLPTLDEKDKKMYFQLAGRVLLIFLFVGFVFRGDWGFWRIVASLLGLVACISDHAGAHSQHLQPLRKQLLDSAPASPAQGLCEIRLLPDPLDCVSFTTSYFNQLS